MFIKYKKKIPTLLTHLHNELTKPERIIIACMFCPPEETRMNDQ